MGMVAAASLTTKLITGLRPRFLAMTGMCAGLRGECEIGDVILGDPVWDWQMGKYTLDAFEIAPDQIGVPPEISQKVALLRSDVTNLTKLWTDSPFEKPQVVPRIHVGPAASGSSVLARAETTETVKAQHRKTLAVDMELYGVYSATRDMSRPRPIAFGLKGVCDHADQYKNDKFQKHASYMSAHVLKELVYRFENELFQPTSS
jgi:nucleoside phosphorylase